jgi:hypothetical protein
MDSLTPPGLTIPLNTSRQPYSIDCAHLELSNLLPSKSSACTSDKRRASTCGLQDSGTPCCRGRAIRLQPHLLSHCTDGLMSALKQHHCSVDCIFDPAAVLAAAIRTNCVDLGVPGLSNSVAANPAASMDAWFCELPGRALHCTLPLLQLLNACWRDL